MKNKFNQFYTNKNGKFSASGFIGFLMGLTTVAGFIVGSAALFYHLEIGDYLDFVLQLGLLSSALLGVRKVTGGFGKDDATFDENKG